MFNNYLITALRNIRRNKLSSGISIFGLAVGIAAACLMFRYIQFELSYDKHYTQHERIYRLSTVLSGNNRNEHLAPTAIGVAPQLNRFVKDISKVARVVPMGAVVKLGEFQNIRQDKFYQVDPSIVEIFDLDWIIGSAETALSTPYAIVLTESTARQFFDNASPEELMTSTLQINHELYNIRGIIKDVPDNSDWHFEGLIPLQNEKYAWYDFNAFTYVLLDKPTSLANFQTDLQAFDQHWFSPKLQKEWGTPDTYVYHKAISLANLHFSNDLLGDMSDKGNINLIIALSLIAIFLLAIASINFINLFVAQSIKRNVEVGIRKVVGANKTQLALQYLCESLLFAFISTAIALVLIQFAEPLWFSYTGISLNLQNFIKEEVFTFLFLMLFVVGIFAGSYTAFFLASCHPVNALKANFSFSSPRTFHKALQLIQFSIATGMILCTMVVYSQLNYLLNKQLGFDQESIMVVSLPESPDKTEKVNKFKAYLLGINDVEGVALGGKPGDLYLKGTVIQDMDGKSIEIPVNAMYADESYLKVLGISILEGNNFNEKECNCHTQFLINESLSQRLQWDNPLGENLSFEGDGEIVGVVKDFHYQSLHHAIEPLVIIFNSEMNSHMLIKIKSKAVESIESAWQTFFPDTPVQYSFLEQELTAQYSTEKHMINLFTFFSLLTILISCMGLFGMSAINVQQKTKAMGIHQVMGARKFYIFYLVSKDILLSVVFGIGVSLPLSGLIMIRWLSDFEYHVSFNWLQLVFSGGIVFILAMVTSCYHGIQIIRLNPVSSLRNE
ncbi:ABC transporter permease [Catalinimonas niigatensis]|uniref:ABC transporter permease n=1 Tax=Catalinimonas niigatensis TaxID=1397264 RepID=UPI0026667B7F|nr:ABC transporter permease [Catalinimonas niigatensis]WPP51054.1 ABC transporter permease [Catalinimonas niigatensis]